ncbi:hypothetical protein AGMMS50229_18650 [Campylobacterota bacterium]|nr:hypothetical protein AGMMS50229_18650 [Campylobacterota bacterium]
MRLLLFLLVVSFLAADPVYDKVRTLVDPQSYLLHQKLIDIIFRDRASFMIDDVRADSVKIATALKENGLLDIFYKNAPRTITASFRTTRSPIFFLKALGDSLGELGYNLTMISSMRRDTLFFEWTLSYKSDHAIDPALLAKRLEAYKIVIADIEKHGDIWFYSLSSSDPTLIDTALLNHTAQEPLAMSTPTGEYWARLLPNAKQLFAARKSGGFWFPSAVFYDSDLNILNAVYAPAAVRTHSQIVPKNAVYIKITDNNLPSNLRNGINLWVQTDN